MKRGSRSTMRRVTAATSASACAGETPGRSRAYAEAECSPKSARCSGVRASGTHSSSLSLV
jgi:hypothetical protein